MSANRRLLQVWLEPEEFEALETWRHEHRYGTRAAAVRALFAAGGAAPRRKGRTPHAEEKQKRKR